MWREDIDSIVRHLASCGHAPGELKSADALAGGVHHAHRLQFSAGSVFLKSTVAANGAMLEAEAAALEQLAQARAVRVPHVLAQGVAGERAFLALEWLELRPLSSSAQAMFGRQLAGLHRSTAERFGWHADNYIGLTPQPNAWCDDWCAFFAEQRLGFQLRLAERNGGGEWVRSGLRLLERLPRLLAGHRPAASLLHGDLWSGNAGMLADGTPVVFDPATHYGDRECDLAMMALFGGFSAECDAAYQAAWPLPEGHETRRTLYQLYHVINHFNLFGGGYAPQAARMIEALLQGAGS